MRKSKRIRCVDVTIADEHGFSKNIAFSVRF